MLWVYNILIKKAQLFLFFAIIVSTVLCGFTYIAVQQNIRLSANDPQIQMAEDSAKILGMGKMPQLLLTGQGVAISQSLAPFIVIYSSEGNPIVSTGTLENVMPIPPTGVFTYTKSHGEDRITWEPKLGTRIAAVVVSFGGAHPGFVLAGRSLAEVENREDLLTKQAVAAETAILVVSFGMYMFLKRRRYI